LTNQTESYCQNRYNQLLFINWCFAKDALSIISSNYLVTIPLNVIDELIDELTKTYCGGELLLTMKLEYSHNSGRYLFLFVFFMLVFAVTEGFVLYYVYLQKIFSTNWFYGLTIFVGSSLNYFSIIAFYCIPSISVCVARVMITLLGYSTLTAVQFFRTYQIRDIYKRAKNLEYSSISQRRGYISIMTICVLLLVGIGIIWNIVNGFRVNQLDNMLRFTYTLNCSCENLSIWLIFFDITFVIIFISTTIVIYSTWSVMAIIVPSFKWLLLANYNMISTLLLMIPLTSNFVENDDDLYEIFSYAIVFTTTWTVLSIVIPQIPFSCCKDKEKLNRSDSEVSDVAYKLL